MAELNRRPDVSAVTEEPGDRSSRHNQAGRYDGNRQSDRDPHADQSAPHADRPAQPRPPDTTGPHGQPADPTAVLPKDRRMWSPGRPDHVQAMRELNRRAATPGDHAPDIRTRTEPKQAEEPTPETADRAEISDLRAENARLRAQLNAERAESADLRTKVTDLESADEERRAEISELKTANEHLTSSVGELQSDKAELESRVNGIETETTELRTENADLRSQSAGQAEKITNLESKLSDERIAEFDEFKGWVEKALDGKADRLPDEPTRADGGDVEAIKQRAEEPDRNSLLAKPTLRKELGAEMRNTIFDSTGIIGASMAFVPKFPGAIVGVCVAAVPVVRSSIHVIKKWRELKNADRPED